VRAPANFVGLLRHVFAINGHTKKIAGGSRRASPRQERVYHRATLSLNRAKIVGADTALRGSHHNGVKQDLTLDHRHEYLDIRDDVSPAGPVAAEIVDTHAAGSMSSVILSSPQGAVIGGRSLDRGTAMSFKRFKKSISITTGGWSGMATPAVAAAAVHSTAPWYWSIGPLALLAVGFVLRRSRRGGGGPPGQGPFGGS
jgi:hypothetical protein